MAREIKRIVIHCSDAPFGSRTVIDDWHKARNWSGIGYHYVICNGRPWSGSQYDPKWDGRVEAGRDVDQQGAHVKNHNADTVGICLIGERDGKFTPLQLKELIGLLGWLQGRFNIADEQVMGHRDLDPAKECPGFDVGRWMGTKGAA